jgi:hypothetical protein
LIVKSVHHAHYDSVKAEQRETIKRNNQYR